MSSTSATSQQIIAASSDMDLRQRITALAAAKGIPSPESWVAARLLQLVAADLDKDGSNTDTIASVYDYAVSTYQPVPPPGANMAAVTDTHINNALDTLWIPPDEQEPSPPSGA